MFVLCPIIVRHIRFTSGDVRYIRQKVLSMGTTCNGIAEHTCSIGVREIIVRFVLYNVLNVFVICQY